MKTNKRTPVKPPRLVPGDTIGVVAPAGPFEKERFLRGVAALESMGFSVSFDDELFKAHGYFAGTDVHRAGRVNRLFADKSIKAIICARGGFGAMRTLALIDYEAVQSNPKIFIGYSDISALLSVLYKRCGLVTFHGPMISTLADTDKLTKDALLTALASDTMLKLTPKKGLVIRPGLASGPVVGGNLTTLCHLVGTPYEPEFKGRILLLEDKGEAAYRIDRMLSQMKLAGCFEDLAGLILGSFEDCGDMAEICRIAKEIFDGDDIPVLAGFDCGHGKANITIPLGLEAVLDTDRQQLIFHEPATAPNISQA